MDIIKAKPRIKVLLATDRPTLLARRLVFIALEKTAEAVFRQKE